MDIHQNRLASFAPKRGKNARKWPHPQNYTANPNTLAEAGFFFAPSPNDPDNVRCFMCEKQLSAWEPDDDPFDIHFEKCQVYCPWALLRCGMRLDMEDDGSYRITDKARHPYAKAMEKARLETFTSGTPWEHDKIKNHGASSKMMAKAGFVHTPQTQDQDSAVCLYCSVCLSGWDPDDDPMEEHRKRVQKNGLDCAFFTAISPKSTKPPKSKHVDEVMPVKSHDGPVDGIDIAPDSSAKTPRKGRSVKKGAKTPRARATRSHSEKEDEDAPPPTTRRKTAHSRSRSVAATDDDDQDEPPQTVKKPSRSRTKRQVVDTDAEESEGGLESETGSLKHSRTRSQSKIPDSLPPSTASRTGKSKAKTKTKARDEDSDVPSTARKAKPRDEEETDLDVSTARKPKSKKTHDDDLDTSTARKPKSKPTRDDDLSTSTARKPSHSKAPSSSKSHTAEEDQISHSRQSKFKPYLPPPDVEMDQYLPPPTVVPTKTKSVQQQKEEEEESPTPGPLLKNKKADAAKGRKPSSRQAKPLPSESEQDEASPTSAPLPKKKGNARKPSSQQAKALPTESEQDEASPTPAPLPKKKADARKPSSQQAKALPPESDQDEASPTPAPLPKKKADAPRSRKPSSQQAKVPVPEPEHSKVKLKTKEEEDNEAERASLSQTVRKASGSKSFEREKVPERPSRSRQSKTSKPPVPEPMDVFDDSQAQAQSFKPVSSTKAPSSRKGRVPSTTSRKPSSSVVNHRSDESNDTDERSEVELKLVQILSSDEDEPDIKEEEITDVPLTQELTQTATQENSDVDMSPPRTPPRRPVTPIEALPSLPPTSRRIDQPDPNPVEGEGETAFFPPLSQDPFVNLDSLTEEELSMTVEEWIHHHIQMEYEKFKSDGERELEAFAKRAEEVRLAIEAL